MRQYFMKSAILSDMSHLTVSVVMPVYNGNDYLERSLDAIRNSNFQPIEVIIVDDASIDGSAVFAEARGDVSIERLGLNQGAAAARNIGVKHAKGDIIAFVDADVCVHPDALGKIVQRLSDEPRLAAIFGAYDNKPAADSLVSRARNLLHAHTHAIGKHNAKTFWTGLGAIRRDVCITVGGLPIRKTLEDVAFGRRLTNVGHRIELDPTINGTHLKRWTLRTMTQTDLFERGIPWIRMALSGAALQDDLNTRMSQRASVACVGLLAVLAFIAVFHGGATILTWGVILLLAMSFASWPDADEPRPRIRALLLLAIPGIGGAIALASISTTTHALIFALGATVAACRTAAPRKCVRPSLLFSLTAAMAVAVVIAAVQLTYTAAAIGLVSLGYLCLNFSFLNYVRRTAGLADAIGAVPILSLYHVICGLSVIAGALFHFSLPRQKWMDFDPSNVNESCPLCDPPNDR